MPDPITHLTASTTLASGGIVTTIGVMLGVDPIAMFCAFMGAIVWRGWQPKIAPTFDDVYKAFSWAICSMVLGTLGGMGSEFYVIRHYEMLKGIPHVVSIGLPAFILSLAANIIVTAILDMAKRWKPKNAG